MKSRKIATITYKGHALLRRDIGGMFEYQVIPAQPGIMMHEWFPTADKAIEIYDIVKKYPSCV